MYLLLLKILNGLTEEIKRMEESGYVCKKEYLSPNSFFLYKETDGRRFENIHVFPVGHVRVAEFIDTRDYLREHPEEAKKYSEIKSALVKKFPYDYVSYRKVKDEYLNIELRDKVNDWRFKKIK